MIYPACCLRGRRRRHDAPVDLADGRRPTMAPSGLYAIRVKHGHGAPGGAAPPIARGWRARDGITTSSRTARRADPIMRVWSATRGPRKPPGAIASRVYPTCAPKCPISGKPEIGCAPFPLRRGGKRDTGAPAPSKNRAGEALPSYPFPLAEKDRSPFTCSIRQDARASMGKSRMHSLHCPLCGPMFMVATFSSRNPKWRATRST